jgi:hypothetical protein
MRISARAGTTCITTEAAELGAAGNGLSGIDVSGEGAVTTDAIRSGSLEGGDMPTHEQHCIGEQTPNFVTERTSWQSVEEFGHFLIKIAQKW